MRGIVFLFVGVTLATFLCACTRQMICPAFQSAYIHDEDYLRRKFSYFTRDSVPKTLIASKTRHLLVAPKPYHKRLKDLRTIEMKVVYPNLDSIYQDQNLATVPLKLDSISSPISSELDSLVTKRLSTKLDSLQSDSTLLEGIAQLDETYMITLAKEKYNVDQDIYMWYFRDILMLPDIRAMRIGAKGVGKNKKKKKGSFFKNLFRKKDKMNMALSLPSTTPASIIPVDSLNVNEIIPQKEAPTQEGKDDD